MRFKRKLRKVCPKGNACRRPKIHISSGLLAAVRAPIPNTLTVPSENILEDTLPKPGSQGSLNHWAIAGGVALTGAALVFAHGAYFRQAQSFIDQAQGHSRSRLPYPNLGVFDADNMPSAPSLAAMGGRSFPTERWRRDGGRLVRQATLITIFSGAMAVKNKISQNYKGMTSPINVPMGNSPFQPERQTKMSGTKMAGTDWHAELNDHGRREWAESFGTKIARNAKKVGSQLLELLSDGKNLFHKIMGSSNMIDDTTKYTKWISNTWGKQGPFNPLNPFGVKAAPKTDYAGDPTDSNYMDNPGEKTQVIFKDEL